MSQLRHLASTSPSTAKAIGECGLDFKRNFSPPSVQEEWFEKQIDLAEELQLPLFMHCRDAYPRFFEILRRRRTTVPGVLHCFTSTDENDLKAALEEGLYIGITGWVADERAERGGAALAALLPLIPDDRLLIETDGPYIVPRSLRRNYTNVLTTVPNRNESALLVEVVREVAAARGQSEHHVAKITTENAKRLFRL